MDTSRLFDKNAIEKCAETSGTKEDDMYNAKDQDNDNYGVSGL